MRDVPVVIVGAGGMGREALAWLRDTAPTRQVLGFIDDGLPAGSPVADLKVLGGLDQLGPLEADCVLAIGMPASRRDAAERLAAHGLTPLTVVHPTSFIGPGVQIGTGSIICPNVTLTRDVTIGENVIVNYGAQLGHDTRVGDFSFIAPGTHIAGSVTIEEGADVGIGASVIQGVTIGAWSRIGAGAAVVCDIPSGVTAVGVPCRPVEAGA